MSPTPFRTSRWKRSSFCATGQCVEVRQEGDIVLVRDSKRPRQAPLKFDRAEFSAFIDGVRSGEFDDVSRAHR